MLRVAVFLWRYNVMVPYFFHAFCFSVLFICLACHCLYQFKLKKIIVCMIYVSVGMYHSVLVVVRRQL